MRCRLLEFDESFKVWTSIKILNLNNKTAIVTGDARDTGAVMVEFVATCQRDDGINASVFCLSSELMHKR